MLAPRLSTKKAGAITEKEYKELYPKKYEQLPESEKDARERYKEEDDEEEN